MNKNREIFEFLLRENKQDLAKMHPGAGIGEDTLNELLEHMQGLRWLRNETAISDAEENYNLGLRSTEGLGVALDEQRAAVFM
jgi:hypothetical protein